MLTGDAKPVGEAVAQSPGLDEVPRPAAPRRQGGPVEALLRKKTGRHLAFVGDGINDAGPFFHCLASADMLMRSLLRGKPSAALMMPMDSPRFPVEPTWTE